MMSQLSARMSVFAAAAFAIGVSAAAHADDAISKVKAAAPLAVCEITPKENGKAYVIWHLTAFDEDGTRYYRAITSNLIELIVKPDGSIQSDANPCMNELTFYSSSYR
jgi:hypothetical protein